MHRIKVIFLHYICKYLFIHLYIVFILISSYYFLSESFLFFSKMQAGERWKGTYERDVSFIKPLYPFMQNIKVFLHSIKVMISMIYLWIN